MDSILSQAADRPPMTQLLIWSFVIGLLPLFLLILKTICVVIRRMIPAREGPPPTNEYGSEDDRWGTGTLRPRSVWVPKSNASSEGGSWNR